MDEQRITLKDDRELVLREAVGADAADLLEYVDAISAETTYISFSPGEFEMTEEQEAAFVEEARAADNCLYLVGFLDGRVAGVLHFGAKNRARIRHWTRPGRSTSPAGCSHPRAASTSRTSAASFRR